MTIVKMAFHSVEGGEGYATTPYHTGTATSAACQSPGLTPMYYGNPPMANMSMAYPDHSFVPPAGFPLTGSFVPSPVPPPYQLQHQHHPQEVHYGPTHRREVYGQLRDRTPLPQERPAPVERIPVSRTIRPITTTVQTRQAKEKSPLDRLSEVIQSKPDTEELVRKIEAVDLQDQGQKRGNARCPGVKSTKRTTRLKSLPIKRLECKYEGCDRVFRLESARVTHYRAHTGAKIFICTFENCGKGFTQPGNLTTHHRRHTGERPYVCKVPQCGKAFVQKSNLTAHERTHLKVKPFRCEFDNEYGKCGKRFTVRGNLGIHQNKFHGREILELMHRVAQYADLASAPDEDRRLAANLALIHKNLNKGIKGRGKGVSVARGSSLTPSVSLSISVRSSPPPVTPSWASSPSPSSYHGYPEPKYETYHHGTQYHPSSTGMVPEYAMTTPMHGLPMTSQYGRWDMAASNPASAIGTPACVSSPASYQDVHENYGQWVRV